MSEGERQALAVRLYDDWQETDTSDSLEIYCYNKGRVDVIDKIVNELEKEIQLYEDSMTVMQQTDRDIEYRGAMRGLGKAIDILKNEAFVIKRVSRHNGNSN